MKTLLTGFLISFSILANAQAARQATQKDSVVVLTLDDCIQTALDRNIELKRAKNRELLAEANKIQSLMNLFPNVNARVNYDVQFGTFFDNIAARVGTETNNSSPQVTASWDIFSGLSNYNFRKQRVMEYEASEYSYQDTRLNTEANIISSYLDVILSRERIKISEERVGFLEQQVERAKKREEVGVGNIEDVYNFRSQLGLEKLNLQTLTNNYKRNKLILIQSMVLDAAKYDYEIADYHIDESGLQSDVPAFDELVEATLQNNPGIKSAQLNEEAAKYGYRSALGLLSPTISVVGIYGSRYSSLGANNPDRITYDGNGNPDGFVFEPNATFLDQIVYNKFKYLGFTLNIPIFNGFRTHNQMQQARIGLSNAELALLETENQVTNLLQQAYLDLTAAIETYNSAKENLEATSQSFEFMKKRFETGNTDFYTYFESLNSKNRSEIELVNAKYSIIFRQKVLELYRGS